MDSAAKKEMEVDSTANKEAARRGVAPGTKRGPYRTRKKGRAHVAMGACRGVAHPASRPTVAVPRPEAASGRGGGALAPLCLRQ